MGDDFDPIVFGALSCDSEVEPATAMAAALPDEPQEPGKQPQGSWLGTILTLAAVAAVLWFVLALRNGP